MQRLSWVNQMLAPRNLNGNVPRLTEPWWAYLQSQVEERPVSAPREAKVEWYLKRRGSRKKEAGEGRGGEETRREKQIWTPGSPRERNREKLSSILLNLVWPRSLPGVSRTQRCVGEPWQAHTSAPVQVQSPSCPARETANIREAPPKCSVSQGAPLGVPEAAPPESVKASLNGFYRFTCVLAPTNYAGSFRFYIYSFKTIISACVHEREVVSTLWARWAISAATPFQRSPECLPACGLAFLAPAMAAAGGN